MRACPRPARQCRQRCRTTLVQPDATLLYVRRNQLCTASKKNAACRTSKATKSIFRSSLAFSLASTPSNSPPIISVTYCTAFLARLGVVRLGIPVSQMRPSLHEGRVALATWKVQAISCPHSSCGRQSCVAMQIARRSECARLLQPQKFCPALLPADSSMAYVGAVDRPATCSPAQESNAISMASSKNSSAFSKLAMITWSNASPCKTETS